MRLATGPLWVLACVLVLGSCQGPMMPSAEPFIIARADYAVESRPAAGPPQVEAEFTVRTSRPSQKVRLLPRGFAVLDWRAAGAEVVAEPAHYVLRARKSGDYRVWLRFLTPLRKPSPGIEEVSIPAVFASSGALKITLPAGTGKLTTVPQAIVSDDTTTGRDRRVTMFLPSSETLVLRWQTEAVIAAPRPSVLAHCEDAFQVKRGLMVRDTLVRCQVHKAPVESLRLAVPPGAAPRAVTGPDVLRWTLEDGGRTIAVTLGRKVADATELRVRCEEVIATAPAEVTVRPVAVAGADLQDGLLRLEAAEDLVLTEVSTSGATRSREAASGGKAVVGYSYARVPASVVVRLTERRPDVAAVTETLAVIEAGVLTVETHLRYQVERRAIRSVAMGLPDGATLLDVSGPSVRDWEAGDARRLTVRFREAALGPVDVAVRFQQNLVKVNGIAIAHLQPTGVAREEGVIGVSAGSGVQLRHHAATLTDQIDVAALPEWVRAGGAKLGYRYRQAGGTLSVSTEPIVPRMNVRTFDVVELHGDALLRSFHVDGQIDEAEMFELDLDLPEGLTPLRVSGKAIADWELRPAARQAGKSRLHLTFRKGCLGRLRFAVETTRNVDYSRPLALGSIDVAAARRVTGGLVIVPRADISPKVVSAQGLDARPVGRVQADARDFAPAMAGPRLDMLAFKSSGPWSMSLKVDPLKAQLATTAATLLSVRHGVIAARTTLACDIQGAGVSALRVKLPEWATNSWVDGPDISSRSLEDDTWTVTLRERHRGTYRLRVTYDRMMPRDASRVVHAEPQVVGAAGGKGFIVVGKKQPSVEITPTVDGHVTPAAPGALPAWAGLAVDVPVVETYEYSGIANQDWTLSLDVRLLSEADVLQIQATDCLLETVICRDGSAVTFMTLTIENVGRQFAKVSLPEERVLWGAYVDGKPVKAAEADEPEAYLVPLLGHGRGGTPVELTVVYTERYPALSGGQTQLRFVTPPVDVPTGSMSWSVFLPPECHLMPEIGRRAGNMELIVEPPDATGPVVSDVFGPDASRFALLWPTVRPWLVLAAKVVGWLAVAAAAVGLVYLVARSVSRARARAAARAAAARVPGGRVSSAVVATPRRRPAMPWAALVVIVVIVLVLAALLLPSLHTSFEAAPGQRSEATGRDVPEALMSEAEQTMVQLADALEGYQVTHGKAPEVRERTEGGRKRIEIVGADAGDAAGKPGDGAAASFEVSRNFEFFAKGKDISKLPEKAILGCDKDAEGYTVLRKDRTVERIPLEARAELARELGKQGELSARAVREDLRLSEEELEAVASQYRQARWLRSRSRANLDDVLQADIESRLRRKARKKYDLKDEELGQSSTGPAGRRQAENAATASGRAVARDEMLERKNKALAKIAEDVVADAQQAAGVGLTVGKEAREAQASAPGAEQPQTEPDIAPPPPPEPTKPVTLPTPEPERPTKPTTKPKPAERPATGWASWDKMIDQSQSMSFAPVVEGRSKGTLPINLAVPRTGRMPYLFMRAFSGSESGQFEATVADTGTGYSVYTLAGLGAIGLAITVVRLAGRRIARWRKVQERV